MMQIRIAFAAGEMQKEIEIALAPGANIADALKASGLSRDYPEILDAAAAFGIWGRVRPLDHRLRDGDRVELYVSLRADPKDARRRKADHARTALRR